MQDIRRQALIAIRWLPLILIGAIAAGAIAFALTSGQPKVYEATARLVPDPGPNPSQTDLATTARYLDLFATQVDDRSILTSVIDDLGLDESPAALSDQISANALQDQLVLDISARDADPLMASQIAAGIGTRIQARAKDLVKTDESRVAEQGIRATQDLLKDAQNRLGVLNNKKNKTPANRDEMIQLRFQISSLRQDLLAYQQSARGSIRNQLSMQRPNTPDEPVEPRPLFWTIIALVVGGMLAAGLAFVIEFLRDKIRDGRDLEAVTGLATVGSIAEKRGDISQGNPARLVMLRHPGGSDAEAYRDLRARIALDAGQIRTLLVAGADETDAHTVVAANLALSFAESGRNVILIDGAYRSPRLHSFFGVQNDRGLSTLAADRSAPLDYVTLPTGHPSLRVMPAGRPPAGLDLLALPQIPDIMGELLQVADMVIFDGPSMASSLDSAVLATHLQASVLVVPQGSRGDATIEAARLLDAADAHLIGTVMYSTVRGSHKGGVVRRQPAVIPPAIPGPRAAQPRLDPARTQAPIVTEPPRPPVEAEPPAAPATPFLIEAIIYRLVRAPGLRGIVRSASSADEAKPVGPGHQSTTQPSTAGNPHGSGVSSTSPQRPSSAMPTGTSPAPPTDTRTSSNGAAAPTREASGPTANGPRSAQRPVNIPVGPQPDDQARRPHGGPYPEAYSAADPGASRK